jgi:hypothetical protein
VKFVAKRSGALLTKHVAIKYDRTRVTRRKEVMVEATGLRSSFQRKNAQVELASMRGGGILTNRGSSASIYRPDESWVTVNEQDAGKVVVVAGQGRRYGEIKVVREQALSGWGAVRRAAELANRWLGIE